MLDDFYLQGPLRECGDKDDVRGYKYVKNMLEQDGQVFTQNLRFSDLDIGKYDLLTLDHDS